MSDFFSRMEEMVNRAASASLAAMGKHLAEEMKDHLTEDHRDTGRLEDSITWATKDAVGRDLIGPAAEEGDILSQPAENGVLHVGTAVPYAAPAEYGSGPHVANGEQSQEFIDSLVEWANRHGFKGKDGGPATEKDLYYLIQYIRKNGTDEIPFVRPTAVYAAGEGSAVLHDILGRFLREGMKSIPQDTKIIDIKIDLPGGN